MIQTMICVWWAILIAAGYGTAYFVWRATKVAPSQWDNFELVLLALICLTLAVLAGATICAIKLAGGGW